MRVDFYHLTRWGLDRALPPLLMKVLDGGQRAVVRAGSRERVEDLAAHLWSFDPAAWLPHGTARDGSPAEQPVWLTERDENPNRATVLVLVDGTGAESLADWGRCLDLFDGGDADAVAAARERWVSAREQGHALYYWQQSDSGGWVEKARHAPTA
ncbi:DNA polymerase III subunit chi [Roseospirillum parvum]|uniref:DNA polymerase III, chi subunit n=1 Tax=Roseospirillum parvum TaxID=83401 RepID=A0A1G7ZUR4_9PROT|nr:DNA polymerase III subunit chi [Roseospirillum parvum]SDH12428.1 DNA polymerase III, chi subunit [Roseospirillum parvum]